MTKVIDPNFETFGWKTHVRERRGSFKITINNLIAVGAGLKHGQPLYCYVAKDKDGRTLIVIYPLTPLSLNLYRVERCKPKAKATTLRE